MKNKNVAVTIQNFVQFYSINDALDKIIEDGYKVDFFVPNAKDDWGLKEMFDDIFNSLKEKGYSVYREPLKKKYKVLLEPYPMEYYFSFNYEYRLKYKYSIISAKPNLTYKMSENYVYDAILCYSTYEADLLSGYTKTFVVGKPMYHDFKKSNKENDKPVLLYLPTYGKFDSISNISNGMKLLKKNFKVITKLHHGTNYFNYESNKRNILKEMFDECYDSSIQLSELLKKADVVLTDNSGSIFEALYNKIPVAIFSKSLDECSFGNIKSYQKQLVDNGLIPYTDDENKIIDIVKNALNKQYVDKQSKISDEIFPMKGKKGLNCFVDSLKYFLEDKHDIEKKELHNYIVECYNELALKNDKNEIMINEINEKNRYLSCYCDELKEIVNDYEKGKLYKISKKIYIMIGKLRWKRKK